MKIKSILFATIFLLGGCTVYTEKQSEAVSQNVYATNDSINSGRIDLATFYSAEVLKFIKPPKKKLKISTVYNKQGQQERVVIVPQQYKNDKVVVIGSDDYENLIKNKEINKQLLQDNKIKQDQLKSDEKEQLKQKQMSDKMVKDLNSQQKTIIKQRLAILWRDIIIVTLIVLIAGYFYLKANGAFFL
jgi:hypothetical protein